MAGKFNKGNGVELGRYEGYMMDKKSVTNPVNGGKPANNKFKDFKVATDDLHKAKEDRRNNFQKGKERDKRKNGYDDDGDYDDEWN